MKEATKGWTQLRKWSPVGVRKVCFCCYLRRRSLNDTIISWVAHEQRNWFAIELEEIQWWEEYRSIDTSWRNRDWKVCFIFLILDEKVDTMWEGLLGWRVMARFWVHITEMWSSTGSILVSSCRWSMEYKLSSRSRWLRRGQSFG